MTEAQIQSRIMLALGSAPGCRIFRNHCAEGWTGHTVRSEGGTVLLENARRARFGLCPGSSDLVGIKKTLITEDMVGRWIGRFVALEVKSANGRLSAEQSNFLNFIADFGGIAAVCKSPEDAKNACW